MNSSQAGPSRKRARVSDAEDTKTVTPAPNTAPQQSSAASSDQQSDERKLLSLNQAISSVLKPAPTIPNVTLPAPNTAPQQSSAASSNQQSDGLKLLSLNKAEALRKENQQLRESREAHILAKSQRGDELRRVQAEVDEISRQIKELGLQMKELELKQTAVANQHLQILEMSQSDEAVLKDMEDKIAKNERGIELFLEAATF
jgi:hypothetical protein